MNDFEKSVLNLLSERIKNKFPESKIWLYGSRAKGTSKPDSDYDLFIVYKNDPDKKKIREIIWEVGFENDILLVGSYLSENIFLNPKMKNSFYIQNVMNQRILL